LSIFALFKSKEKNNVNFILFISISSPFILFLLSILYSDDINLGLKRISTMLSLIAFPIIFWLLKRANFKLPKKHIKKLFVSFSLVNVTFFIITFWCFWAQEFNFTETIVHYSNLINIRLGKFSQHPIYYSIYISVAVISMFHYFLKSKKLKEKIALASLILFLLMIMGILMRKGPIIYLFVIIGLTSISYINFKKGILLTFLLVLFTGFVIEYFPKYKSLNRFEELINYDNEENNSNSTKIRLKIYKCSIEKIFKSPFIGYGVGSTQAELDPCYEANNIDLSVKTYNSHNQYFSIALTGGILSFLIYFAFLIYNIKYLMKKKSFLGISIFLVFILNFLTENVIERENGAIFYSFLMSLLLFYDYEKPSYNSL
jgi:O-antigen ligase